MGGRTSTMVKDKGEPVETLDQIEARLKMLRNVTERSSFARVRGGPLEPKKGALRRPRKEGALQDAQQAVFGYENAVFNELIPAIKRFTAEKVQEIQDKRRIWAVGLSKKKEEPRDLTRIVDRTGLKRKVAKALIDDLIVRGFVKKQGKGFVRAPGKELPATPEETPLTTMIRPDTGKPFTVAKTFVRDIKAAMQFLNRVKDFSAKAKVTTVMLRSLKQTAEKAKKKKTAKTQQAVATAAGVELVDPVPFQIAGALLATLIKELSKDTPGVTAEGLILRLKLGRDVLRRGLGLKLTSSAQKRLRELKPTMFK